MSVHRIGTSGEGHPLVLMDLDEPEREAIARLLLLAEAHLDEILFPDLRSRRRLAEEMIRDLRTAAGLLLPDAAERPEVH